MGAFGTVVFSGVKARRASAARYAQFGGFFVARRLAMKYTKPPLTLEQRADLLLSRGMKGDRATMIARLAVVNYYRLSGYWHPFRNPDDKAFKPHTTPELVPVHRMGK